jgi:hypothetical protein
MDSDTVFNVDLISSVNVSIIECVVMPIFKIWFDLLVGMYNLYIKIIAANLLFLHPVNRLVNQNIVVSLI